MWSRKPSPKRAAKICEAGGQGIIPIVTLFGDSISSGYGLPTREALPARLQSALSDLGLEVKVLGAGFDGDTTADGLARLSMAVPDETDLCIVALGANDLMQALSPHQIMKSLDAIVTALKARGMDALLCGMKAPPWLTSYAPDFDTVFSTVAQRHRVAFYPFLLDGVALDPRLNQTDGIHPNAAGISLIAGRLAAAVRDALRGRTGGCP